VGRAITNKDYKFLAYLLVKTHREGNEAICDLEARYRSLNPVPLDIDIGAWKGMFDEPEPTIGPRDGRLDRVDDTPG
jgi:hypothetical protein